MSSRPFRFLDSYRARVLLAFVLVLAVLAIAWGWSLAAPLSTAITEQQQRQLLATARVGTLLSREATSAQTAASDLAREAGIRVTIVSADGTVLADSDQDPASMENHASRPEIRAALGGRTGVDRRVSRTEGVEQLYVAVPATFEGAAVALRASQRVANIQDIVRRTRGVGLTLLLVAVLVAVVAAIRVSASLARPVEELARAAQNMAAGDLGTAVPRPRGELGALGDALADLRDEMRERIDSLEAEESSLRSVLDGLDDAVWLVDGDTIRFANRAASVLFKQPVGGWRDRDIGAAGLPAALRARILDWISRGERHAEELPRDPTGRALRLTTTPFAAEDSGRRVLVVVSDVTERTRLEQVRRDFVANASHELKTPVAGIHLLAQSAAQAASDGDDQQAREFSEQIERESGRLQQLVKDLLDLSRLEAAPASGSISDVRAAVENAVLGHQSAAAARGLPVTPVLHAIEGQDVYAAVDPTDLAVALDNLLDNAIAYTESGRVTVRVSAAEETVNLAVQDTGIGIPPEDLPRIFERFYRVDRSRARDSGGTGLGLALVKHSVERVGGSVLVESAPGKGSTFTLVIPRAH